MEQPSHEGKRVRHGCMDKKGPDTTRREGDSRQQRLPWRSHVEVESGLLRVVGAVELKETILRNFN